MWVKRTSLSRGAPYRFGSAIEDEMDRHPATHEMLQKTVREWFPRLKDVRFTHTWGGPLGWPRDFMPTVSLLSLIHISEPRDS